MELGIVGKKRLRDNLVKTVHEYWYLILHQFSSSVNL